MAQVKKKVLVVDDERHIINILSIKLRVSGYDVLTALDGRVALELVDSGHPDIMLLDIIMPGMDGFEALKKLRTFSDMPVIVLSARPENRQEALKLGANDFMAKPFDVDDLVARIQKTLNHRN